MVTLLPPFKPLYLSFVFLVFLYWLGPSAECLIKEEIVDILYFFIHDLSQSGCPWKQILRWRWGCRKCVRSTLGIYLCGWNGVKEDWIEREVGCYMISMNEYFSLLLRSSEAEIAQVVLRRRRISFIPLYQSVIDWRLPRWGRSCDFGCGDSLQSSVNTFPKEGWQLRLSAGNTARG